MRKAERLLYILSLLRVNHRMRARELARKCGVTERTIYRDITSISEASIPIYFDGGYKLLHSGFLPPASLSPYETAFLIGVLKSPVFAAGKVFRDTVERITDKLKAIEIGNPNAVTINIGAAQTEKPDHQHGAPVIENAIRERRLIRIVYLSLRNEATERLIAPYALVFRKHAWYLVGYCHLREEVRTFRIGRVQSVELCSQKFEIPRNFSVEEYFGSNWNVCRGSLTGFKVLFEEEAAVSVKTSQHYAGETVVDLGNGKVAYEVSVASADEFIWWILGFGQRAEILEPQSARRKVKRILADALRKYDQK